MFNVFRVSQPSVRCRIRQSFFKGYGKTIRPGLNKATRDVAYQVRRKPACPLQRDNAMDPRPEDLYESDLKVG
jgi:hypothetical protein